MPSKPNPDLKFLVTLRANAGWMSAVAVASAHGVSWYAVAFALRRLAEQGLLEEDVVCVAGKQRSQEMTRLYRARPQQGHNRRVTDLPAWLAPQAVVMVGVPTLVEGEAGMRRWEQQDADRRRPHPMRRKTDVPDVDRRVVGAGAGARRRPATLAWRCTQVLWKTLGEKKPASR